MAAPDYLSPAQASVVAAMRSGYTLMSAPGCGFWLNNPAGQGVTHTAEALLKKGFIERDSTKGSLFCVHYQLTEKAKRTK